MFLNFNLPVARRLYRERRLADDYQYRELYRFSREEVDWLSNEFLPECYETRGGRLSNHHRMLIFLRYISDPGHQV